MKSSDNTPVVLFVYDRFEHTLKTVQALQNNFIASSTRLYIFSDGARTHAAESRVNDVRRYLKNINGFSRVEIIERKTNYGLARNIIEGVTEICNKSGKVIVLEDDIVTAPYFLTFMNNALERYADEKKIWHISGWNYPINPEGLGDAFLWRMMNCWGWATWSDRWKNFSKDVDDLKGMDRSSLKRFNLDGAYDFWSHIEKNISGEMNTWAIFWYATIFKNNALALNPAVSLVDNIGHDGSGTHCEKNDIYNSIPCSRSLEIYPEKIEENKLARKRIKMFYKRNYPALQKKLLTYPYRKLKKWITHNV